MWRVKCCLIIGLDRKKIYVSREQMGHVPTGFIVREWKVSKRTRAHLYSDTGEYDAFQPLITEINEHMDFLIVGLCILMPTFGSLSPRNQQDISPCTQDRAAILFLQLSLLVGCLLQEAPDPNIDCPQLRLFNSINLR